MGGETSGRESPLRFLADEMLGRLARYLRFAGFDTAYARGLPDPEILRWTDREQRILLTRDRSLAAQRPSAVLLTSGALSEQFQRVRALFPGVRFAVRFDRCTECNGDLRLLPTDQYDASEGLPDPVKRSGTPVYRCAACGHLYWEGTHTRAIRERFAEWGR